MIVEERRPNLSPTEKAKAKVKYGIGLWWMFDEYMKSVPDWNIKGTSDGGLHGDGSQTSFDGWQIVDDNYKETGQYGAAISGTVYHNGMPLFDFSGIHPGALAGGVGDVNRESWDKIDWDDFFDSDAVEVTYALSGLTGNIVGQVVDPRDPKFDSRPALQPSRDTTIQINIKKDMASFRTGVWVIVPKDTTVKVEDVDKVKKYRDESKY
jgi:hypothetical protein